MISYYLSIKSILVVIYVLKCKYNFKNVYYKLKLHISIFKINLHITYIKEV